MSGLNPALEGWLEHFNVQLAAADFSKIKPTPELARRGFEMLTGGLVTRRPAITTVMESGVDAPTGTVPVRIYHPEPEKSLPVLIYLHGGGHMCGSVDVYDPICRKMALASQRIVISVEYRRSPEFPFPAGMQDAYAVLSRCYPLLQKHQLRFSGELALGGDSAGGAMSATLAHLCQYDSSMHIKELVLIYPSLDYTMSSDSYNRLAAGYFLEREKISWYFENYFLTGANLRNASPLFMDVTPSFPSTFIVTAGYCPLQDEGLQYIRRLQDNDIPVIHCHYPDMIHAFLNMEDLVPDRCADFYNRLGSFLS